MMSVRNFPRIKMTRIGVVACLFALIAPLVIGWVWGPYFHDHIYATFHAVHDWVNGQEGLQTSQLPLDAPVYLLVLAFLSRLGVSLPTAALTFSVLGWGMVAIAVYSVGMLIERPIVAHTGVVLIATSPLIIFTLGMEISWTVAWAWIAIAALLRKRWYMQTVAMILMLCTHFDACTLILVALLIIIQGCIRKEFPLWSILVSGGIALAWGGILVWRFAYPVTHLWSDLLARMPGSRARPNESDLQWFLFLLACLGLLAFLAANWRYSAIRKMIIAGLVWIVFSVWSGSTVVLVMVATLILGLVGFAFEQILRWLEIRNRITNYLALAFVIGVPLAVAQISPLMGLYQRRPVRLQALEREVGAWLQVNTEKAATVFASERVGYFANRHTLAWDGNLRDSASLVAVLQMLGASPPTYCVSYKSLAWDYVRQTAWFQENYVAVQQFALSHDSISLLTVWEYRFRTFDTDKWHHMDVRLPQDVDLVGYQYVPRHIEPGEAVYAALFLRASQPFTEPFRIVTELFSNEGVGWAQDTAFITHPGLLAAWWQIDAVVPARFVLTTTADVPIGAYRLRAFVTEAESQQAVPLSLSAGEPSVPDLTLGYVAVPWQGTLDKAVSVDANLDNQIQLLGYEPIDRQSPGATLEVTLYWEAQRSPDEDYTVFVHLLDARGQLVASHDGMPMLGRYPTKAWLPGDVVPDTHYISLDSGLAPGTYRLQVGMYRWPSLERLLVWDGQGIEQPERVFVLQNVEVR